MNVVISKEARDKLRSIMEKLELSNVHVGVEKSIELAYKTLACTSKKVKVPTA